MKRDKKEKLEEAMQKYKYVEEATRKRKQEELVKLAREAKKIKNWDF